MAIDENIETCAPVTEDLICDEILQKRNDELENVDVSSDEDDEPEPPTRKQVREALEIIRRSIQCRGHNDDFEQFFKFEKSIMNLNTPVCTQTNLSQFF